MKKIIAFILIINIHTSYSQIVLESDGPGNTYELINSVLAPGYNVIEVPDCAHATPSVEHIDEVFDTELNTNVFRFIAHKTPDNDRCQYFDRQRTEIKTYDKSPDNLLATIGETVIYKWKFKISSDFQPSSRFTHVHQIKSVGGSYASTPMVTLTLRKSTPDKLELRYTSTNDQNTLKTADLDLFRGNWVSVIETITYSDTGSYAIEIKNISNNETIFNYTDSSLDAWQDGAEFARPKWGIYRSLISASDLKDEAVLFADFSIEEVTGSLFSGVGVSQTQPTVHNANFDKIAKSSGDDCTCSGWINRDLAAQGENSTSKGGDVVKFDDLQSDGIYQEFAVETNSNYTLNLSNMFSVAPTSTSIVEIYILKGSGYEEGYTPVYAVPAAADQDDLGYRTLANVKTAGKQITKEIISAPADGGAHIAKVSFNTGTETSIAIFVRGIVSGTDVNGDSDIRIDDFSLINNGLTVSNTPTQPTVHNANFDKIAKSSGSDCTCSGWINRDLATQGASSTSGGGDVVKFDDLESDGIYQEFAVETNSNYTLNLSNMFSVAPTSTSIVEIYILKGSGYEEGYTPVYAVPAAADQDDLGYRTLANVKTAGKQITKEIISAPADGGAHIAKVSFNTGTETSIAIFVRGIVSGTDVNGDSDIRIDDFSLINNGYSNNVWQGGSTAWETTDNWGLATLPTEFNRVVIGNTGTNPIIGSSTGVKAYNLNVNSSASLNISPGGSLIVEDLSVGNVTYNRTLSFVSGNANGWHLVASPVAGQTYNNAYATTNGLATSGTKRGLATFNDANGAGLKYTYLEDNDSNAGTFTSGIGYSAKRGSAGTMAFTGTINTADVNSVAVSASADGFDLLGVPYTSYISSQTFLSANTNLDQSQIWVWKQGVTGGNYIAMTAKEDNFILAPGQGFFVKKANTGATVNFVKTNQQANADTFQKTSRTEVKLLINDGEINRFAKLYYVNKVTKGYDVGWEGEVFGGLKNSLDVFSQLVEGNQGKNYQVQSLPISEIESITVPVGVTAEAGKEITFSVESLNLPSGIKVFLEDRVNNTFTRLDEANTNYKVTTTEALNSIGRFYLYTTQSSLGFSDGTFLESVSIYRLDNSTIRVSGLSQGKVSMKLFNLLGKQAMNISFQSNGVKDISLPKLATGIYIVKIETEAGQLNKKIIIE